MSWIETARRIVANHQYETVHTETGEPVPEKDPHAVLLDATSAHLMVQMYDALNETNRERFAAMPLVKAVDFAWKLQARLTR